MKKRVLMIAFHYPPCHGSSGLQRTLAFTRYLELYGWQPALLTVTPNAYESTSRSLMSSIPSGMPIKRVFTLDAARHLSILGRYPSRFAVPDRWVSWRFSATRVAAALIQRFRPGVIWSTFPIATAHRIAADVAERNGLPWIADMRDPMVEHDPYTGVDFPEDPVIREARLEIENLVMQQSRHVVFCTEGAKRICVDRYGSALNAKFSVIPNGYDEEAFTGLSNAKDVSEKCGSRFVLLHSGTVYPGSDRGPEGLFRAIQRLASAQRLPDGFRLVFRATGHDDYLESLVQKFELSSIVRIEPPLIYREALREMLGSDALLVIQGPSSNPAIPAKIYEYFRARKPLLGLVHPHGDTAALLRNLNAGISAALDDPDAIADALELLFSSVRTGECPSVSEADLPRFSRRYQTGELASLLDSI